jgi:hypothetical protein
MGFETYCSASNATIISNIITVIIKSEVALCLELSTTTGLRKVEVRVQLQFYLTFGAIL